MNRKVFLYGFLGIFLLVASAIILYVSTFIQPKIIFTAEINQVSDEEYRRILNNAQVMYPKKEIDKFKHVSIGIKAVEPIGIFKYLAVVLLNMEMEKSMAKTLKFT